jgi:hypothetical protein
MHSNARSRIQAAFGCPSIRSLIPWLPGPSRALLIDAPGMPTKGHYTPVSSLEENQGAGVTGRLGKLARLFRSFAQVS